MVFFCDDEDVYVDNNHKNTQIHLISNHLNSHYNHMNKYLHFDINVIYFSEFQIVIDYLIYYHVLNFMIGMKEEFIVDFSFTLIVDLSLIIDFSLKTINFKKCYFPINY